MRRPWRSNRTDTLFPVKSLVRSRDRRGPWDQRGADARAGGANPSAAGVRAERRAQSQISRLSDRCAEDPVGGPVSGQLDLYPRQQGAGRPGAEFPQLVRSEEHTSELQSLMRNSDSRFRLQNKKPLNTTHSRSPIHLTKEKQPNNA